MLNFILICWKKESSEKGPSHIPEQLRMYPVAGYGSVHQIIGQNIIGPEIGDGTNFGQAVLYGVSMYIKLGSCTFHITIRVQIKNGEGFKQLFAVSFLH